MEVHLFSGRPNPSWPVSEEHAREFVEIWNGLGPASPKFAAPRTGSLGYRGCTLTGPPDQCWEVGAGVATHEGDQRSDPGRRFERALLGSAPAGRLEPRMRDILDRALRAEVE